MATISFKDTKELIDYLCQEDTLGELLICFSQDAPYPTFNFDYPELQEHLETVLDPIIEGISAVGKYEVKFINAEDWDITGSDYADSNKLTEEVKAMVNEKVGHFLKIDDVYLCFNIEGDYIENIQSSQVHKLELYKWSDDSEQIPISDALKTEFLVEIAEILQSQDLELECIHYFQIENLAGTECVNFYAEGQPFLSEVADFEDDEEFILDTDRLKKKSIGHNWVMDQDD